LSSIDINRYSYECAGLLIIATGFDLDIPNLYPAVYNHLLKFEEKAKKRDDQGKNWWNLRACKYYNEFEKEKIIWADISTINPFALFEELMYLEATAYILTSDTVNLKYLIACLNSKITFFEFRTISNSLDKAFRWTKQYIEQIHVPIITAANQHIADQMIELVEQITAIKKANTKADTSELEGQIDRLVYQLYDLTKDEIAIIEREDN
ncbi:MAG TPA: TaqI-like C-terminal specificity domain-containing protein, partial [Candidatus Cloacimonadota bacterium]|nr:TaqI-like C-terminal specificity domain-containing protein [Candidatus Cloacimonadota bacterium]